MKVVITGPTGAIGHAIIEECIASGYEVLAICRKDSVRNKTIPVHPLVRIAKADVEEYSKELAGKSLDELKRTYGSFDVFFHLAWRGTTGADRMDTALQEENVRFALDAVKLAYALGCRTFIGAGSQAEYGRVEGVLEGDTPTHPENEYGRCKLLAGIKTRKLCEELGMRHIWTRVLSVYGPFDGEKSMIISSVRKMIRGERASFTKGEQEWDYLYASDAGRAFVLLAEKGIAGKTYVVGSGECHKLYEYIDVLADEVNKQTGIQSDVGLGDIPYGEKQVMMLCADITELTRDTGFVPEVSFQEGIAETIRYVIQTMESNRS